MFLLADNRRNPMPPVISPKATSTVLALAFAFVWCSAAFGQPPPKATSQDLTLMTKDGLDIKITYFKSAAGQEAPVVILLHGKGGNRLVWKTFAEQLQKVDFAVITVDLRGHGESTGGGESSDKKPDTPKKAELAAMAALDLDAVKKFIYEEHQNKQLNMNKLGIVASDVTFKRSLCCRQKGRVRTRLWG
jgi:poly(3-hydroxybutyrate) depolymerase